MGRGGEKVATDGENSVQIAVSLSALWRGRRRADAAIVAVIAAFFMLMFAQQIFGGKFLLAGDPLYYSYPLRSVGWEMIRGGQLPLWTPLVMSGYPLLSMSQLAFAYPLTWGYLFLPGHWAEQAYVLAPFLLSPVFTYAYARETGRSRTAALLAGLSFGYGGMMCSGIAFTGLPSNSMLWLPLVLIPIDRAATGRGRFVPLLAAATAAYAMSVLNGQGQSFLYTGMVAAAYGLYVSIFPPARGVREEGGGADDGDARARRGAASYDDDGEGAAGKFRWRELRRWRPLFVALGALLMSAGIAAFQILETMRAARRSIRNTLSFEAISTGAFTLREAAASVVMPLYYSTDVSAYVPSLALVFAALACFALLAHRDERRDARIYFWLGVAVVGWVLMLGSNTPAQQLVYRLPLLNKFRVPSRHTFEWTFAVSIIAAYGWDVAARRGWLLAKSAGASQRSPRAGASQRNPRPPRGIENISNGFLLALCIAIGTFWWRALQVAAPAGSYDYTGLPVPAFLVWKISLTIGVLLLIRRSARCARPRLRAGWLMAAIAVACFVEPSAGISRWYEGMLLTGERFRVVSPTTRLLQNYPPSENRAYTRVELYSEEFNPTPRLEAPNLTALHRIQNIAGYEPLIFERYSRALGSVGMDTVSPREGHALNDQLFHERSRVLDLLNTTFVVSFSNLSTTLPRLMYQRGVAFYTPDMQAALEPGKTVTLGGAAAGDTLALVSSLSNAGEVEQGVAVARVRAHFSDERGGSDSRVIEREVRAGVDTAEWAHERADVRRSIRHALAPVFDARPGDEKNSYPAHRYITLMPLGERGRIDRVEITNLTTASPLALWKATLHDSVGGISTPVTSLAPEWLKPVYQHDHALVLENKRALPRAWLVGQAQSVDGEEALRLITGQTGENTPAFDPRRTALLEVAPAELPQLAGGELPADSAARVTLYEPNRLVIHTRSAQGAVLVLSEMFYPGWEATVDGVPARIHLTNYLLRGVVVGAGEHRVEMRYVAPAARNGAVISAATLAGLCVLVIFDRRTKRRKPGAQVDTI